MSWWSRRVDDLDRTLREHIESCDQRWVVFQASQEKFRQELNASAEIRRSEQAEAHSKVAKKIEDVEAKMDHGFEKLTTSISKLHERDNVAFENMARARLASIEERSKDRSQAMGFVIGLSGVIIAVLVSAVFYLATTPGAPKIILPAQQSAPAPAPGPVYNFRTE